MSARRTGWDTLDLSDDEEDPKGKVSIASMMEADIATAVEKAKEEHVGGRRPN